MESSIWLRLWSIVLIVLGSFWVLAPTFLAETDYTPVAVSGVVEREPPTEAWFVVPDGDADQATAEAVRAHLEAAGVAIDGVRTDRGRVVVVMEPGTRREQVADALAGATDLPEPVTRWVAPQVAEEQAAPEQVEKEQPWWRSLLPPTEMAFGLDLVGGIDITLQVDQDAAVTTALLRDRRQLEDTAATEGFDLQARRDRTRYALMVRSSASFEQVRDWVLGQLRGRYGYTETRNEDGQTWHVFSMLDNEVATLQDDAVEQNLETLRRRVDATGVKEPTIVKMSGGRINIQLPGVHDTQSAVAAIGRQATLEFRMVDARADQNMVARYVAEAEAVLPADQLEDPEILNEWLRARGYVPAGRMVLFQYDADPATGELIRGRPIQLVEDVEITGADIASARSEFGQTAQPIVTMSFKPRGAQRFCEVTTANVGRQFAIILDDQVRSAPTINEAICGGSAQITLGQSINAMEEANTLALVLRTGALTAPVDVGEVQHIGASLGADAIDAGQKAAIFGVLFVFLFVGLWYGTSGWLASASLAINVLLIFTFLALFGATLTLPGIAGIALTVATAVDANIIIFERIREELKLGVNARKAVEAGYEKAFSAILDGNLTTAIAGIVLYSYGTGPIRGFAVTLLLGIICTMITALYVSRAFLDVATRRSDARLSI